MRILLLLILLLQALPASGGQFFGPLRTRNMTPFSALRLDMPPDHAVNSERVDWAVELHFSSSNTFVSSKNVKKYLTQRGTREPIRPQDVAGMFALPGDVYYFDGSISIFDLRIHKALAPGLSVYAAIPGYHFGGGFMDSTIEDFHRVTGLTNAGREFAARNNFQVVMRLQGDEFVTLRAPASNGLGDPSVGLRYAGRISENQYFTIVGAYKYARGSERSLFSTGGDDYGLEISWQYLGEGNAFYASFSQVRAGETALFPEATRQSVPSFTIAWETVLGPHTSFVAQMNGARSAFLSSTDPELVDNAYQITVGLRNRVGPVVWSYGLTENLINFDNSADLGVHVGFAYLFAE